MKIIRLIFLLLLIQNSAFSQKDISIHRIEEKPNIDGELNEAFWDSCDFVTGFTQNKPIAGANASKKTEIKIAYDDQAIYVGAVMYDDRDSMSLTLSQRDDFGNADWFGVVFDPYNAGTIGFAFLVTSAGVQVDELHQVNDIDDDWNAVWQSSVRVYEDKWIAELKIPFSALRFPDNNEKGWGINFARNIRRNREMSFWNEYDPTTYNLISNLGQLKGLGDIDTPLRLSFTPYVSGYVENFDGSTGYTANGGLDLKYGVNDAFTLDMTLIPDFGQVKFDNQVLNLSPFEVRFNERRQFFTEGTELFNKAGLFYSRRIGGSPINYDDANIDLDSNEVVNFNPNSTRMLNATKFSGRTQGGLGIGVFNAVTANMYATVENTETGETRLVNTSPLSNYSVFVFDQNLKNNSSVTLTNTNVMRDGHTYDANVTALGTDLYTKGLGYNVWSSLTVSQQYEQTMNDYGYMAKFGVGKTSGNLQWRVSYTEKSDSYDINDLGFLRRNNTRQVRTNVNYNIYDPFWRLYRMWSGININYTRLVAPDEFASFGANIDVGGTFRNFMAGGVWVDVSPFKNRDWFEPRIQGRFYEDDENISMGGFISSDYSQPFALDVRWGGSLYNEVNRYGYNIDISPRFRFNDKFFMVLSTYASIVSNEEAAAISYDFELPMEGNDPLFAIRDRLTVINRIEASYIFNNKMGITFNLRHYWAKVEYESFFVLNEFGQFDPTTYTGMDSNDQSLHDNSFNAFTIDMAYKWVFAPGSELSLVWKNSIFDFSQDVMQNYFQNANTLAGVPATNSLSLKLLYYIDYWSLHQKIFKKG